MSQLASIVVSSYNYDRFLAEAIDSALSQTYPVTEVIVVDDGSTDDSRDVIARYTGRVNSVLKGNGGQASAFNAGFDVSSGDIVIFLDSDDVLLPTAVEKAIGFFEDPDVVKVHWPLYEVDARGVRAGNVVPARPLSEGDVKEELIQHGPHGYTWPPTSGNAWARRFLQRIFPMPEPEYKTCPDFYLSALAPLFGLIRKVDEPQALWRVHGTNQSWSQPLDERITTWSTLLEHSSDNATAYGRDLNITIHPNAWSMSPYMQWLYGIDRTITEITATAPEPKTIILIDQAEWQIGSDGRVTRGTVAIPFMEKDGRYWGPPADDSIAIQELERLREVRKASLMVFASPHFWWLGHYAGLRRHLRSNYSCVGKSELLIAFDLTS